MKKLKLKLISPERVVFESEVDQVTATTQMGEITILPGHIPLVANLQAGEVWTKANGREEFMVTSTGFLEIRLGNEVYILADTAERLEELEEEKILEARKRAEEALKGARETEDVDYAALSAALERELARHRVLTKRKKYRKV
ncbi:MAG: ATP synthase epsilon chain [Parcubacteria group bacterium GW2011_GWA2_56_7]|nr:MAG: ATP synthase epsilon chain [Parcubacteria group bacterium GW2011_GWA2_56_7]